MNDEIKENDVIKNSKEIFEEALWLMSLEVI